MFRVCACVRAWIVRNTNSSRGAEATGARWQPKLVRPSVRFCDVGGVEACISDIVELIEYPLTHPEIFSYLGVHHTGSRWLGSLPRGPRCAFGCAGAALTMCPCCTRRGPTTRDLAARPQRVWENAACSSNRWRARSAVSVRFRARAGRWRVWGIGGKGGWAPRPGVASGAMPCACV